ncbi:MAG: Smr/MutS family protein [Gammaproteobacteria bacterium]|nr:Smr/MutS family protein [Gammaproteobacteria bacterium]
MSKKIINDDDSQLFRQAVADAKPLSHDKHVPEPVRPKPIPLQKQKDEQHILENLLSDHYDPNDPMNLDSGEEMSYHRPGIQHSALRKLRRGQYSIQAELDLHGLTVKESRTVLLEFLDHARHHSMQCVRIIHGKGRKSANKGPVLKPMVGKWLTQLDCVLAFCTARPVDGGSGAVYVLLKRG